MSQERVMLLIDADNLSVDVMEQAIRLLLNQHGGLHVRRAYCTAESAVANQNAFKRLGIKPMVNLAAGKNSTDIAMAVDAIDLVLAERPDVVVIASSDSDFAPLVQRLREKGCVVRGIGQRGKVGDETQDVYDDYTVIEHRGGTASRAPARSAAKPARASRAGAGRAAKPQPAAGPEAAAARVPAAKATGSRGRGGSRRSAAAPADDAMVAPRPVRAMEDGAAQAAEEDLHASAGTSSARPVAIPAGIPGAVPAPEAPAEPPAAHAASPAAKRTTRARKTAKPAAAAADATASPKTGAVAPPAAEPAAAEAAQPLADVAAAPAPARSRARKTKTAAEPAPPLPPASAVPPVPPRPAAKATAPAPAAAPAPQQAPAAEPAASSRAAPRANLQAVLDCLPELSRGQSLALNVAVQRLRETRLLGKNSSSLKLFSQLSDSLELLPARNPSQVRLRR